MKVAECTQSTRVSYSLCYFLVINGEILIKNYFEKNIEQGKLEAHYNNNYFKFEVSNYIKDVSKYKLVQRRKFQCNSCDHVCVDNRKKRSRLKRSLMDIDRDLFYDALILSNRTKIVK